ncbi:MAG: hypothetical protein AAF518_17565 [Spirochaetota bacterium]
MTASEYKYLFGTDQVTVVAKEAKKTQKKLLDYMEQVLVAHLEREELLGLQKIQQNILNFMFLERRIQNTANYILTLRGFRE